MRFAPLLTLIAAIAAAAPAVHAFNPERERVTLAAAYAQREAAAIEASAAIATADGIAVTLWASEALVKDAVGLDMDDQGTAWLAVTQRRRSSMFDIRSYAQWVPESWSWTTVAERKAFLRRVFAPKRSAANEWLTDFNGDGSHDWRDLTVQDEEFYRIRDVDSDGRADQSDRFRWIESSEETDIAGSILRRGDSIYVGLAPDLWRIRDADRDGEYDVATSISHGYGIHIGFGGHAISGIKIGPDGRLYWAIGDIGFSGTDQAGQLWSFPRQGSVVRCELNGSGFEVYAAGLRNTHEFDWDEYGNLISVDNDGDHEGEEERIVYLINGSDTGWRNNWQLGKYTDPKNNAYKVWMDELYFKPRFEGQAAHILPAIANYRVGPAGLVYNPGTALSEEWRNHFFVATFTGNPVNSAIEAFALKPKGAAFEVASERRVMSGLVPVGIDFGPDGALYLSDWGEGWGLDGIGRIWKLDSATESNAALRTETQDLLRTGFGQRDGAELSSLLSHADRRVRLESQFELAERGDAASLRRILASGDSRIARIHALWGLGQISRRDAAIAEALLNVLDDRDEELRAQAAKMLGDIRYGPGTERLIRLLRDASPRVQLLSVEALGRIGAASAFDPIVSMLEANDDREVYLRHAGAIALARIDDGSRIELLDQHPSRAVRIAAVVALTRREHSGLARFLSDSDDWVVANAARGINDDTQVTEALPSLARLLGASASFGEPVLRRAINANLFVGGLDEARRLAAFARNETADTEMRIEALHTLEHWAAPSIYDRVSGRLREPPPTRLADAQLAIDAVLNDLLASATEAVRLSAVAAASVLRPTGAADALLAALREDASPSVRTAALEALGDSKTDPGIAKAALELGARDSDPRVRMAALRQAIESGAAGEWALPSLLRALSSGALEERQLAYRILGSLDSAEARRALAEQLEQYEAGALDPAVRLDLLLAIEASGDDALSERIREMETQKAARDDPLARFDFALEGGDAKRGRSVFYDAPAAQCVRCHTIGGAAVSVGPDLQGIGARRDRAYLLQSLIDPSARIAPGFGGVSIDTVDGRKLHGTLIEDEPTHVVLRQADGALARIQRADIKALVAAPSSMPPMGLLLSKSELRDTVAFLASLRAAESSRQAPDQDADGH